MYAPRLYNVDRHICNKRLAIKFWQSRPEWLTVVHSARGLCFTPRQNRLRVGPGSLQAGQVGLLHIYVCVCVCVSE